MSYSPEEIKQWSANRRLPAHEVLAKLSEADRRFCKVVGVWVWYINDQVPSAETRDALKALGFKWNRTRRVWQHPCNRFTKNAPNYDPRTKYQTREPDEVLNSA